MICVGLFAVGTACQRTPKPPPPESKPGAEIAQRVAAGSASKQHVGDALASAIAGAVPEPTTTLGIGSWGKVRPPAGHPMRRGKLVSGDRHALVFEPSVVVDLPASSEFLPCGENVLEEAPFAGERFEQDAPVYWSFEDGARNLLLRFAVDGVVAMARDESCVRELDLSPLFMGTGVKSVDDVFAPSDVVYLEDDSDPVARLKSEDADGVNSSSGTMKWEVGRRETALSTSGSELLKVRYDLAELEEWSVQAGVVGEQWFRLTIDGETPGRTEDAAIGRRDTLVWPLQGGTVGEPLFHRQRVTGDEDLERSDERATLRRSFAVGNLGAQVQLSAAARMGDRPLMLGVGKCPQMEGLTDVKWFDGSVGWKLSTVEGEVVDIGTARRWQLQTAGCLDAVRSRVKRGAKTFSDRLVADPVTWSADVEGESQE